MKTFSVYLKKNDLPEKAIFIEEGFSFKACIFTYLWFIFNKLWFFAFAIFAIHATIISITYYVGIADQCMTLVNSIFAFYIGISANQWKEFFLLHQNYELKEIIVAKNIPSAQLKFFDSCAQ